MEWPETGSHKNTVNLARGRSQIHYEGEPLPLWETKPSVILQAKAGLILGGAADKGRTEHLTCYFAEEGRGGGIPGQGPF